MSKGASFFSSEATSQRGRANEGDRDAGGVVRKGGKGERGRTEGKQKRVFVYVKAAKSFDFFFFFLPPNGGKAPIPINQKL